jgi:ribosomal-protein-serine acetyltransferase
MILYQDDTLSVRVLQHYHAEALYAIVDENRAYLRPWMNWVDDQKSPADSLAFIKLNLEALAANNGLAVGIWYKGELVGSSGYLFWQWASRSTEIGYWITEAANGKGIMTRTCVALIDYAFETLRLNRVLIMAATENRKSRAIPERLGFNLDGVLREDGWLYDRYVDHAVYSMLARHWPATRPR